MLINHLPCDAFETAVSSASGSISKVSFCEPFLQQHRPPRKCCKFLKSKSYWKCLNFPENNIQFLSFSFQGKSTIPETNIVPENGWLEYFPFGTGAMLVSGSVYSCVSWSFFLLTSAIENPMPFKPHQLRRPGHAAHTLAHTQGTVDEVWGSWETPCCGFCGFCLEDHPRTRKWLGYDPHL